MTKIVDSWNEISHVHKAIVLKNYFEKYIHITGMMTGFQAFVMTMDTVEKTDYLPVFLMTFSFLGNIFICFASLITCNVLSGGYYTPCFDMISVMCMYALAVTNSVYFVSMMWSSHTTFIESDLVTDNFNMYLQFMLYILYAFCGTLTGMYFITCEQNARHIPENDVDKRSELIEKLK
jgi:hypothetical protein